MFPESYCEYSTPSVPIRIEPCPSSLCLPMSLTTSAGGARLPLYHVRSTVSVVYLVPGKVYFTCTSSDQL